MPSNRKTIEAKGEILGSAASMKSRLIELFDATCPQSLLRFGPYAVPQSHPTRYDFRRLSVRANGGQLCRFSGSFLCFLFRTGGRTRLGSASKSAAPQLNRARSRFVYQSGQVPLQFNFSGYPVTRPHCRENYKRVG